MSIINRKNRKKERKKETMVSHGRKLTDHIDFPLDGQAILCGEEP
jgi:hypothetical protein